jgi:3-phytase
LRARLLLTGWFGPAFLVFGLAAAGTACAGGGEPEQAPEQAPQPAPQPALVAPAPTTAPGCARLEASRAPRLRFGPVGAAAETKPVPHRGDAADDAAIWVHPRDPARSVIVATDKKGGIVVYDLAGRELQYREGGRMNNVDLRCGFRVGRGRITLVAATERRANVVALFRLDERSRRLVELDTSAIEPDLRVYGLCLHRSARTGAIDVIVTGEDGELEQWQVISDARGRIATRRVRRIEIGSQAEGCVADDRLGYLYVGEEDEGIWKYGADADSGTLRSLVDSTDGGHIRSDVEGLTLLYGPGDTGYLVASSQGDSSFSVYERAGANRFAGSFRVVPRGAIDGAEDTDGIDGVAVPLPPAFPAGLLVIQDGENAGGRQNFKLVRLRASG